ncbi:hypothetical protein PAXRUDRAFT_47900, partial [Paxillus rubicundulus Ve08.2h10]
FGPATLFSTEHYELFNHVFRLASMYSNHQAPSCDTCQVFAEQNNVKHIITKKWARAELGVIEYMIEHPKQHCLLGLPEATAAKVGECLL